MNQLLQTLNRFIYDPEQWKDLALVEGTLGKCRRVVVGFTVTEEDIQDATLRYQKTRYSFVTLKAGKLCDDDAEPSKTDPPTNLTVIEIYRAPKRKT